MAVDFDVDTLNAAGLYTGFEGGIQSLSPPFTFFIWAKPIGVSAGTGQALLVKNKAVAQGFADTAHFTLEMQNSAGLIALQLASAGDTGSTAGTIVAGVWQACAANFVSNSDRTAYYNGIAGTHDTTSVTSPDCGEIQIGARIASAGPTFFRPFHGCLAHAAIWNIALSPADHAELASGVLPPNIHAGGLAGNLVLYVPMVNDATKGNNTYGSFGTLSASGSTGTCSTSPPIILTNRKKSIRWF